jgi:hypothetical protein
VKNRDLPERVDLSSLGLSDAGREALVRSIMARYRQTPVDLWSALAAYIRRPVVPLAIATSMIASVISVAATRPTPQPAPRPAPMPSPIARWVASSSMPTPVEVMEALSEVRR